MIPQVADGSQPDRRLDTHPDRGYPSRVSQKRPSDAPAAGTAGDPPPPEPAYYASTSFGRSWNAALDAMEDAVTAEQPKPEPKVTADSAMKKSPAKKIGLIYAGVVAIALILALLLRGLIH